MRTRAALTFVLAVTLVQGLMAQAPQPPQAPTAPAAPTAVPEPEIQIIRFGRPAVRIGQDYTLRAGDAVRDAVIILGDATIDGRVDQNVVVILGDGRLGDTAVIDGSVTVIGGTLTASANTRIDDDLVIVGGGLNAPAGFMPRGEYVVVGSDVLGGRLQALTPWFTQGLLWGRLIVPSLGWVWGIVFLFFLAYAALNLLFGSAVLQCAQTLAQRPLTAFAVGVLSMLLVGPICVLLAVSVVGIAVIPFVVCALIIAGIVGRVAVARWMGMSAVHEENPPTPIQSFRSLAIGFAIICVALMIPIVGILTWIMLGVLGLGSAVLTFMAAYRREHPPAPKRTPPPAPVTPPAAPYTTPYTPPPTPDTSVAYAAVAPPPPPSAASDASAIPHPPPIPDLPPAPPYATVTNTDLLGFGRASFLDRMAALVLDAILVAFVLGVLDIFDRGGPGPFFFFLVVYHIAFWTWKATTLGGIIVNLRVIRMDGYRLRLVDALVRGVTAIFSAVVIGLGFLWILKDPERQAWHDRIAGTYVVKVPRHFPL